MLESDEEAISAAVRSAQLALLRNLLAEGVNWCGDWCGTSVSRGNVPAVGPLIRDALRVVGLNNIPRLTPMVVVVEGGYAELGDISPLSLNPFVVSSVSL